MAQLFGSPVNAALLNVFFLTDANKKDPGIETSGQKTTDVKSVSIIGAGIMGSGIAAANLRRGLSVTIADARPEVADQAVGPILEEASYNRETKRGDLSKAVTLAGKLHVSRRTEILAQSDLVVEAVVEHLETKQRVLRELDELMPPTSILATNTSTIPITRLADGLKHPGRFCGVHFFNPVRTMQLVEVIRGPHTTDDTVAAAVKYAKQLGKFPVVLKDGPGFLINRLLMPYMNEALHLVAEGASFEQVDKAAKRFGMPMGPIELYDMVGLDTALFAGKVLCDAFPDRYHASPILLALVEVGRLGRKSGAGFFNYKNNDKKSRPAKDPQVMAILQPFIATSASAFDSRMLTSRLFLPMLNEASRALEEGLVRGPRDVDLGMIFGTGFPPFRGGLLFWADQVGIEKIFEMASTCIERGARYQPTELMTKLRRDRRRFYDLTR
jgi:3-hydroxyacyl-CoA dehydrogenase/enoyl-CoA hydratase/3-hydroxybutyryl-CoA epimerase/3-hydroxyacyl-CoA dehydrogenase/enoyl-CoA hydratase/3-hydroxybutyryl-CoA epimerase/enoyl-CoA isomerase